MILDMEGSITTSIHKICISNSNRKLFLTVHPKLKWTDNISFARTFETIAEANEFEEMSIVKDFLENELNLFIWTDTKESAS